LYSRRDLQPVEGSRETSRRTAMMLPLSYPEIKAGAAIASLSAVGAAGPAAHNSSETNPEQVDPEHNDPGECLPAAPHVISSYLDVTSDFHNQMVAVQQRIMRAYLAGSDLSELDK